MSLPLGYLLITKFKNQIKSFFRTPGKLIYLVFIIAILGVSLFSVGKMDGQPDRVVRDIGELAALVTVFYSVMFMMIAAKGFGSGASLFSMADVNFVFPSPLRQRNVLFYGLLQKMGSSLLLGLFLLFQFNWMHNLYDISFFQLVVILIGYALTVFLGQVAAMAIYIFTSADDVRRGVVKAVFYVMAGGFLLYTAAAGLGDKTQFIPRAVTAVNGTVLWFFPVSGWTGHAVSGFLFGHFNDLLLGAALCAAFIFLIVWLITHTRQDYYEDVLKSTEITQSAITARKEGRVGETVPQKVKVGKTGLGGGWGASALFYKHRLENRRARVFIMDTMSLIFAAIIIVLSIFTKSAGLAVVFVMSTTMQIFTVALGRFNKELLRPYIYMIPDKPLKKMLYALAEDLPSYFTEALVIFIPIAFILQLAPLEAALCVLARLSFALLFTAGNNRVGADLGRKFHENPHHVSVYCSACSHGRARHRFGRRTVFSGRLARRKSDDSDFADRRQHPGIPDCPFSVQEYAAVRRAQPELIPGIHPVKALRRITAGRQIEKSKSEPSKS